MASKALAIPLIRHVAKRGYAQAVPSLKEPSMQSSVLHNNIFVAAFDNSAPVVRCTVAFKAGSRYEPHDSRGVSHVLRSSAGLSTGKASNFILLRQLAQIGATLTTSGDREFLYYTLESTGEQFQSAMECLNNLISMQEFRPWEMTDNAPRLHYELAALTPQARAVDLLHQAAYRRGLGNSIFINPKRVGAISAETVQHFAKGHLIPKNCAVTIVGDSQDKALLLAQALQLNTLHDGHVPETCPGTYYGGESRKDMSGELAHVAVAVQGASAGTPKSLALAIAAKALGSGPVIKWGSDTSVLAKAIGNIGPFAAAGFNVSYSDSGLFGAVLTVPKDEANAAVKSVVSVLKKVSLDANTLKAARNALKLQILSEGESAVSLSENLAAQGFYTGGVKTPAQMAQDVDKITDKQISEALASVGQSKLSIGSVGNLAYVPYVDEL